jgi:hypothetical protein
VVTINKGSRIVSEGHRGGHPSGTGGTHDQMAPHYATVLLVTVGVVPWMRSSSGPERVGFGREDPASLLRYVDLHADIQVGDTVVASVSGKCIPGPADWHRCYCASKTSRSLP